MIGFLYKSRDVSFAAKRLAEAFNASEIEVGVFQEKDYIPESTYLVRLDSYRPTPGNVFLNDPHAVGLAKNKAWSRAMLGDLSPKTWIDDEDAVTFPCIVRPAFHSQGRNLYYCANAEEYDEVIVLFAERKACYVSEYIPKVRELRVFVVGLGVVAVSEKIPTDPTSIAWNLHQGASMRNLKRSEWPLEAVGKGVEAANVLEVSFGAVDVIIDAEGKSYVLEVNTAPGIRNPYTLKKLRQAIMWEFRDATGEGNEVREGGISQPWHHLLHPALHTL